MRKRITVLLAVMVSAALLTGCTSTIKPSIDEEKNKTVTELQFSDFLSEEDGFHFPGIPWGTTFSEFQEKTGYSVTELLTYEDEDERLYEAEDLLVSIFGRPCDTATLHCRKDDVCKLISVAFSNEEESKKPVKQEELYDRLLKELTGRFGEPDEITESTQEVKNDMASTETRIWRKTSADGKETELQFATMSLPFAGEPVYVTVGFFWKNAENETE